MVNFAKDPFSVELREVPVPAIGASDVLLRVGAVSVCGSDVHQWRGSHSWPVNYPCILGHEFSGTVAAAGADVKGFREGDRVVSETAAVIDETSPLCRGGLYNLDPTRRGFGYGVDGAMTEYVRVPARCLHRIPDQLPFERAALTEPCCVAYNAVCVNGRVRPGDTCPGDRPGSDRPAVRAHGEAQRSRTRDRGRPAERSVPFHRGSFARSRCNARQRRGRLRLPMGRRFGRRRCHRCVRRFGRSADGAAGRAARRTDHQGRLGPAALAVQPGSAGAEERHDLGKLLA